MISLWLLLVEAKRDLDTPNAMPKKNELANSCYFTYKMGFILCDSGTFEERQQQMEKGACHRDYFLAGADFQRSVDRMYFANGPPPLEEVYWLLSVPGNFQQRTYEECPAVMVLGYLLCAETLMSLFGPDDKQAIEFYEQAVSMTRAMEYGRIVLDSWPITFAFQDFENHLADVTTNFNTYVQAKDTYATFVVCYDGSALDWITALNPFPQKSQVVVRAQRCPEGGLGREAFECEVATCSPFGPFKSTFVVFLPSPLDEKPNQLFQLALHSLRHMIYNTTFLHLGHDRIVPVLTECQTQIYESIMGHPPRRLSTYAGSHFIVRGELTTPPAVECPEGYGDGLWGPLFLQSSVIPLHADDGTLPRVYRIAEDQSSLSKSPLFLNLPKITAPFL